MLTLTQKVILFVFFLTHLYIYRMVCLGLCATLNYTFCVKKREKYLNINNKILHFVRDDRNICF